MVYGGMFGLVLLGFWLWALYNSITSPDSAVRNLPKVAWVFVVLLFNALGAMAWVLLGRPQQAPVARRIGAPPETLGGRLESEEERIARERREYYRRMDEELDRRLAEKPDDDDVL